jgi:hypothetical protein
MFYKLFEKKVLFELDVKADELSSWFFARDFKSKNEIQYMK